MRDLTIQSRLRRSMLLIAPAALTASFLRAQTPGRAGSTQPTPDLLSNGDEKPDAVRLPNGKNQTDEILKSDYEKNLKDARELTGLARGLEEDLEKNEAFVFSLSSLKKLDDMERLTKRIRARMKRY
jgi:hypothetical protein